MFWITIIFRNYGHFEFSYHLICKTNKFFSWVPIFAYFVEGQKLNLGKIKIKPLP